MNTPMASKKIYTANCIEVGERFKSIFKTAETSKSKLMDIGHEMASTWGGECTSVVEWKPGRFIKLTSKKDGKKIETTERSWNAWVKKHLTPRGVAVGTDACPYNVEVCFDKEPNDVYDYDVESKAQTAVAK